MSAQLIVLKQPSKPGLAEIHARLREMAVILTTIDAGELLAALPPCPLAQRNHLAALNLLTTLEAEMVTLANDLE